MSLYGEYSIQLVDALEDYGDFCRDLSEYDYNSGNSKGLEYYLKASKIEEKVLGKEHPNLPILYNKIGDVYFNQGDYSKTLEYNYKALAILEKVLGKEDVDTAISYRDIGNIYYCKGNYSRALEYHIKALKVFLVVWGEKNYATVKLYSTIGNDYRQLGQYNLAINYISKAIENSDEPDNNILAGMLHNRLGRVYELTGDKDSAYEHFLQAIDMLPEDHEEAKDSKERIENLKL